MQAGAGGRDLFGSRWLELRLLDRALGQLTRPALAGSGLPATVRDQLRTLGVQVGGSPRREELIAELWGRKRPLMQQLYAFDDPMPPCA
ncbi:MAG TPA: hypothetical protein VFB69_02020 [Candidatus Dormibacteraeota bacterium]|nr:hypothetical protein [Candidatus Dormibacteraeota bacterium]